MSFGSIVRRADEWSTETRDGLLVPTEKSHDTRIRICRGVSRFMKGAERLLDQKASFDLRVDRLDVLLSVF